MAGVPISGRLRLHRVSVLVSFRFPLQWHRGDDDDDDDDGAGDTGDAGAWRFETLLKEREYCQVAESVAIP
ncbi:GM24440 [Drosophila sechellia]|uniref:GM24440 n=1 Tax=Drosophila sechellia TaxID=7238 RepID=B4HJ30_DROSE|nr:GM24440 [Drosophila sechellia]